MGKNQKKVKDLDHKPPAKEVSFDNNIVSIESQNTMQIHGGKIWDTLFILVKDNDKQFIYDFCNKIPCQTCKNDFIIILNRMDLDNKSRDELLNILWECRCEIHSKYKKKTLTGYLEYLKLNC